MIFCHLSCCPRSEPEVGSDSLRQPHERTLLLSELATMGTSIEIKHVLEQKKARADISFLCQLYRYAVPSICIYSCRARFQSIPPKPISTFWAGVVPLDFGYLHYNPFCCLLATIHPTRHARQLQVAHSRPPICIYRWQPS